MIDWNNNGKIDPVDVGISIAISQDNETDEARNVEENRLSLLDKLMNWIKTSVFNRLLSDGQICSHELGSLNVQI